MLSAKPKNRFWKRLATSLCVAVTGLAFGTLALGAMVFPAAAALACPQCYGFAAVSPHLYIERQASAKERATAQTLIARARQRDADFYGPLVSTPRILFCESEACYRRLHGGRSKGMALLTFGLVLSPRGLSPVIAAHELSHIELHERVGLINVLQHKIPQWFDEGVAVVVSNDPRYIAPLERPDRCLVAPDGTLPTGRAAWVETAAHDQVYAKAACRVSRWMADNEGSQAVIGLAKQLAAGRSFATAYAAPLAAN